MLRASEHAAYCFPVPDQSEATQLTEELDHVRDLRLRWLGHTLQADADIEVDPTLSLTEAHTIAHHAEHRLLTDVRRLTAASIHTSPAGSHPAPV